MSTAQQPPATLLSNINFAYQRALIDLAAQYQASPGLRALLMLVVGLAGSENVAYTDLLAGGVGALEVGSATIAARRTTSFFEGLSKREGAVNAQLNDPEFVQQFLLTMRAANRSGQDEKARLFGRLLGEYARLGKFTAESTDEHEEAKRLLEDLSIREWKALTVLARFERVEPRAPGTTEVQWRTVWWARYFDALESEVGIPRPHISGFLARLARTGLYEPIVGGYWNYLGDQGLLSPRYTEFMSRIGYDDQGNELP